MKVFERFSVGESALGERITIEHAKSYVGKAHQDLWETIPVSVLSRAINRGVGIEIETENVVNVPRLQEYWNSHKDGSLRGNSNEFVTPYGVRVANSKILLDMFDKEVRKHQERGYFTFGERTSVHVHLDCRLMTEDHVRSLIILYVLFENPLFDFAGPERKSNIFTIPFRESNMMHPTDSVFDLVREGEKYCAFNLTALANFGTVEFRHMAGTFISDRIFAWIMILSLLTTYAQHTPIEIIQQQITDLHYRSEYEAFIEKVFHGYGALLKWNPMDMDLASSDAKLLFKDKL